MFDQPLELPVEGKLWLESPQVRAAPQLDADRPPWGLEIHEGVRMQAVRRPDGLFIVQATEGEQRPREVLARSIIVAIGQQAAPPRIHSRGGSTVDHLADARASPRRVVVVSLGDAAMEGGHRPRPSGRHFGHNSGSCRYLRSWPAPQHRRGRAPAKSSPARRTLRGRGPERACGLRRRVGDRPAPRKKSDPTRLVARPHRKHPALGCPRSGRRRPPPPRPLHRRTQSPGEYEVMKALHVGLFSCLGMVLVGGAVFAVTPAGGFSATAERRTASVDDDDTPSKGRSGTGDRKQSNDPSSVSDVGSVLTLEGRMGHAALLASDPGETYVMLEVRGDDRAAAAPPNAALSIVIDKSGSMAGTRITNALQGAVRAVEQLRDGDTLSVIAFDTARRRSCPPANQRLDPAIRRSRPPQHQLGAAHLDRGLEGLADLESAAAQKNGVVTRMILLSDGKTNNGIRDIPGFNGLAQRALAQGVNITTIGVDVDFDEKVMSAIAVSSNGRHYFVENDVDLTRVFEQEAQNVVHSVASNVVADLELAPASNRPRLRPDVLSRRLRVFAFAKFGAVLVSRVREAPSRRATVLVRVRIGPGRLRPPRLPRHGQREGRRRLGQARGGARLGSRQRLQARRHRPRPRPAERDRGRPQGGERSVRGRQGRRGQAEARGAGEGQRVGPSAREARLERARRRHRQELRVAERRAQQGRRELRRRRHRFPGGAPAPAPVQRAGKARQTAPSRPTRSASDIPARARTLRGPSRLYASRGDAGKEPWISR